MISLRAILLLISTLILSAAVVIAQTNDEPALHPAAAGSLDIQAPSSTTSTDQNIAPMNTGQPMDQSLYQPQPGMDQDAGFSPTGGGGNSVTMPSEGFQADQDGVMDSSPELAIPTQGDTNSSVGTKESDSLRHKWRIRPVLAVGYAYDDNVFISNTNPVASSIYKIAGGFSFDAGDFREFKNSFFTLTYLGVGNIYSQAPQVNCYNQYANLLAQYTMEKLRTQLESRYTYQDAPNTQVGGFTTSIIYVNALRFLYTYSQKTELDFELSQISDIYPSYLNSYYNQGKLGATYQYTQKVQLGLEAVLGSNPAQNSPTRYYETLNGRFNYDVTGKLTLKSTGGIQFNEYPTAGVSMRANPVLSLGADYKLFSDAKAGAVISQSPRSTVPDLFESRATQLLSDTSISLNLYRNQQSSAYYSGQDFIATGGEIGFNKSFGLHWVTNLSFGYENDDYIAIQQNVNATRQDNFFFFKPSITYKFLKYLEYTIFFEHSMNNSTIQTFTYSDNRIGMELKSSF